MPEMPPELEDIINNIDDISDEELGERIKAMSDKYEVEPKSRAEINRGLRQSADKLEEANSILEKKINKRRMMN